jgi:hypothetical protein
MFTVEGRQLANGCHMLSVTESFKKVEISDR